MEDDEVKHWMDYVDSVLRNKGILDEDLLAEGKVALTLALKSYDEQRSSFKTWLVNQILFRLRTLHNRNNQHTRKIQFYCVSLDELREREQEDIKTMRFEPVGMTEDDLLMPILQREREEFVEGILAEIPKDERLLLLADHELSADEYTKKRNLIKKLKTKLKKQQTKKEDFL